MELTLIRHAESEWNATGTWQGQSDVPLSPRGRLQVHALANRMFGHTFDHGYASDLSRVIDTAAAVQLPFQTDPRFREIDVGEWAGLTRSEVRERFEEQVEALRAGEPVRIGGGESMAEFEARVDDAIDDLGARHAGERVLLVTHGGVIRALITRILHARTRHSPLVGVGNTSISRVREEGGRLLLELYNDLCHLDPADQDSALVRLPEPSTRMAVIAAAVDGTAERALVDAILGGLGIASYYASPGACGSALAEELFAEPLPDGGVDQARREHVNGAFAVVVRPEAVPLVVGSSLSLDPAGGSGLAPPEHGSVTQVRLFATRAELYSYGVSRSVPLA